MMISLTGDLKDMSVNLEGVSSGIYTFNTTGT